MKFVMYSGAFSINSLGDTKSLFTMLAKEIFNLGHEIAGIGRGLLKCNEKKYCYSSSNRKFKGFLIHLRIKILRTFFKFPSNDIGIKEFNHYANFVADKKQCVEISCNSEFISINLVGIYLFLVEKVRTKCKAIYKPNKSKSTRSTSLKKEFYFAGTQRL